MIYMYLFFLEDVNANFVVTVYLTSNITKIRYIELQKLKFEALTHITKCKEKNIFECISKYQLIKNL